MNHLFMLRAYVLVYWRVFLTLSGILVYETNYLCNTDTCILVIAIGIILIVV